ncbi:IclR family transcriptional regulator [Nocardia wallacei]|uniref:IclR family transcriptional regulator n=1 Tax=Nocardia wallacei TaxID=480035 RepID=UPI002454B81D|nr:IclR family transcriptional regulator [Nocardia wallacei]
MAGPKVRKSVGYRERNSTADRALDILQLFSEDRLVLSGAEISQQLGVARSTAYRYLQTLVSTGFMEDAPGGFRLGPRIFQLARLARAGIGLSEISLPVMRELARQTGETALLTRRSGHVVVCLERVEASRPVRLSYDRGQVLPINAGAAAEVLLAWASSEEIDAVLAEAPLRRFTPKTLVDPRRLNKRLAEIRKAGFAVSRSELDENVVGVAAPIRDSTGAVRAAVSIAALAARLPAEDTRRAADQVCAAAAEIASQLSLIES